MRTAAALAIALLPLVAPPAWASKPDRSPRQSVLLHTTPGVIVCSAMNRASLYDLQGNLVRIFDLGQLLTCLVVSPDEQYLLAGGNPGRVRIWRIADGSEVVTVTLPRSGHVYSASFSADGSAFGVAASGSMVAVYRTADGAALCEVEIGIPLTITLTPDASTAFVLNNLGKVIRVSVKDGRCGRSHSRARARWQ